MSKIKVKNIETSKDHKIVDSCMQLISSVVTGEFFEEDNFGSFKSVDDAMNYLDQLASPVIDFRSCSDSNRILIPERFAPSTSPLALRSPSLREAMKAINIDFPKSWRKQISKVVWK